jgi:hypothetical protein
MPFNLNCISYKTISKLFNLEMVLLNERLIRVCLIYFLITVFIGTKMTGGKTVSRVFFGYFCFLRNILMDIKILHIDSNNPILMRQLQELGLKIMKISLLRKNKSRQK